MAHFFLKKVVSYNKNGQCIEVHFLSHLKHYRRSWEPPTILRSIYWLRSNPEHTIYASSIYSHFLYLSLCREQDENKQKNWPGSAHLKTQ